jgi:dephospho-CoA kinase
MPVAEKVTRADFVIWSEGALENHSRQVNFILDRLSSFYF